MIEKNFRTVRLISKCHVCWGPVYYVTTTSDIYDDNGNFIKSNDKTVPNGTFTCLECQKKKWLEQIKNDQN